MVKIHQHVKFQAIPFMHSLANVRKPLRTDGQTDGRTCCKTVTVVWVDQRTHVHVKRGYFRLRTDGRTDGQPENIMPPAPKGGGIKTLQSGFTADNVSLLMFSNSIQLCYHFVGNSESYMLSEIFLTTIFKWHAIISSVFDCVYLQLSETSPHVF